MIVRKIKRIVAASAFIALIAIPVSAQDVAGKWAAKLEGAQGPTELTFEFQVKGGRLTGTVSSKSTGAIQISEGMIMGRELSFVVRFEEPGTMATFYRGVLKGNELTLTTTFEPGGPPMDTFTATRVTSTKPERD